MVEFSTPIKDGEVKGSIYLVVGKALDLMRELGVSRDDRDEFRQMALAAGSYAEALAVVREWLSIERRKV